jgi:hypothetical protein
VLQDSTVCRYILRLHLTQAQILIPAMSAPLSPASSLKKRRRPALSCEPCRRRKVKCDRNQPCGQCVQSKIASCAYSPIRPAVPRRTRNPIPLASFPGQSSSGLATRVRSIPSSLSTQASSVDVSPSSTYLSTTTHPSSYGSPPIVEPGESHQEETLRSKDLLDRIRNLEAQLAIAKSEGTTGSQPPIPNATPKKLGGIISKTRFLGGTHWMYSQGAVCYHFCRV